MTDIQKHLFELQDLSFKKFHCALIPTVDPDTVIGVRTPLLRKFARSLDGEPEAEDFLLDLPHSYYEENNLHGFLIEACRDYRRAVELTDQFLPYVNNWATCDLMRPKIFGKHLTEFLPEIQRWIASSETYTVRFGIGMLMNFYLEEAFDPAYLSMVSALRSDQYYVNMMTAWFFATALAKQYRAALPYLQKHALDPWTHNKTIQKALESYRISAEEKAYLRTLKRK